MKDSLVSRRAVLAGTAATGALSLTGFPARAEPQWKKYAGTTLEANLIKGPRGELLQKYASEFTDLTGIKVESEVIPGAAAAAEGRYRAHFGQAELRRHSRQLSRAEAAIRKGRLARGPDSRS